VVQKVDPRSPRRDPGCVPATSSRRESPPGGDMAEFEKFAGKKEASFGCTSAEATERCSAAAVA